MEALIDELGSLLARCQQEPDYLCRQAVATAQYYVALLSALSEEVAESCLSVYFGPCQTTIRDVGELADDAVGAAAAALAECLGDYYGTCQTTLRQANAVVDDSLDEAGDCTNDYNHTCQFALRAVLQVVNDTARMALACVDGSDETCNDARVRAEQAQADGARAVTECTGSYTSICQEVIRAAADLAAIAVGAVNDPDAALIAAQKTITAPVSGQPAADGSLPPVNGPIAVAGRVIGGSATRVRVSVMPIGDGEGTQLLLYDGAPAIDGSFTVSLANLPSQALYAAQSNDNVLNVQIDAVQVSPVTRDVTGFASAYTSVRLVPKDSEGTGMVRRSPVLLVLQSLSDRSTTVSVPPGDAPSAADMGLSAADDADPGLPLDAFTGSQAAPLAANVPAPAGSASYSSAYAAPVPPGCGLVSGPEVTTLKRQQRLTVLTEMHAYWDAKTSYRYTETADTDVSVAFSYDAGKTFRINGTYRNGNSIGGGITTPTMGPFFGRQVRGVFKYTYDRLRYYCESGDEFDHFRIQARGFGGYDNSTPLSDFGKDVSSKDGGATWAKAPQERKARISPGFGFYRTKGRSQAYGAAVSAFGITLGGQTANNQQHQLTITAGNKPQNHDIWGSNAAPFKAENVYSY